MYVNSFFVKKQEIFSGNKNLEREKMLQNESEK